MRDIIDFILPTCPGIPDSMWIVTSAMLDATVQLCWKLLGAFLTIRFLWEGIADASTGKIDLRSHIKILFHALLIAIFLAKCKFLIMCFDSFIDMFCVDTKDVTAKLQTALEGSSSQYSEEFKAYQQGNSWFTPIKVFFKIIFDFLPKMLVMLSQGGAIKVMHYIKVMVLLPTILLGPFSAVLSLLPGPFKKSFSHWFKSYINISSWAITLHIFSVLTKHYMNTSLYIKSNSTASAAGEIVGGTLLSIGIFIAIFLTPTFTSKFLGSAIVANLGSAMNIASSKLGLSRRFVNSMNKIK